jgi:hypothetical protein
LFLLFCGLAFGQATIIGGTASTWAPAYGVYAAPFAPLVTTPEITLSTVSPAAVGASNATFGLVAGATNATLSSEFVAEPPVGVYTEPVWNGQPPEGLYAEPIWYGPSVAPVMPLPPMHPARHMEKERPFEFVSQPRESVAQAVAGGITVRKASRTYTNQDVDHVNQTNGTVKYRGKTEHI